MRATLLTFICLCFLTSIAFARLGETPEQLEARLGPATPLKQVINVFANGHAYPIGQILNFSKGGWSIGCYMINGTCAKITYVKTAPFTDDDINTILTNEAQGSKWAQSTSTTTVIDSFILPTFKVREWKRADGADAQTTGNSFTLTSPEYQRAVDAANAQAKADAEKKMPNL